MYIQIWIWNWLVWFVFWAHLIRHSNLSLSSWNSHATGILINKFMTTLRRRIISSHTLPAAADSGAEGAAVDLISPMLRQSTRPFLTSPEWCIQTFQNRWHLHGVELFFFEFLILFIMNDIFFHSIFKFILILTALDIAICHYPHYLFVVIKNWKTRKFRFFVEECSVGVAIILILRISSSKPWIHFLWLIHHRLRPRTLAIWL